MKTLILTCNTGGGHNSCAKSIKEYYDLLDSECDISDALQFISDRFSRMISKGHTFIYRHLPRLFDSGYCLGRGWKWTLIGVELDKTALFGLLARCIRLYALIFFNQKSKVYASDDASSFCLFLARMFMSISSTSIDARIFLIARSYFAISAGSVSLAFLSSSNAICLFANSISCLSRIP